MRRALLVFAVIVTAAACSGDDLTAGTIEVTAEDYSFSGVPERIATGAELTIVNDAPVEVHEIVLLRIADGEDREFEELLELPDEESADVSEFKGVLLAMPGETGFNPEGEGDSIVVDEPGRYVIACFIPQGTTREIVEDAMSEEGGEGPPPLGDGAPHAVLGMVAEFTAEDS